jgi:hypothetical protein
MSQDNLDMAEGADIPDFPGPNALGHTPLLGSARRSSGLPVIRDEVAEAADGLDAVDLPDKPVLPILTTR